MPNIGRYKRREIGKLVLNLVFFLDLMNLSSRKGLTLLIKRMELGVFVIVELLPCIFELVGSVPGIVKVII